MNLFFFVFRLQRLESDKALSGKALILHDEREKILRIKLSEIGQNTFRNDIENK